MSKDFNAWVLEHFDEDHIESFSSLMKDSLMVLADGVSVAVFGRNHAGRFSVLQSYDDSRCIILIVDSLLSFTPEVAVLANWLSAEKREIRIGVYSDSLKKMLQISGTGLEKDENDTIRVQLKLVRVDKTGDTLDREWATAQAAARN